MPERRRRCRRTLLVGRTSGPALLVAFVLAVTACSDASTLPMSDAADAGVAETNVATAVEAGEVALFDSSVVHHIEVDFDQADYEALVATYAADGEKAWMPVTVTIDGVRHENAGMRLKGNSSLRGLATDGGRGGPSGDVDADAPEGLPWLIRLDKYVDGAGHQGYADLVIRSNGSETSLNEALALDLLDEAGLASQAAIAVAFTMGDDTALRLAIEHPDDVWMAGRFDAADALYKAESTGDYRYRGDDPDAYQDVFDQEAGEFNADLEPLIDFLEFVETATDDQFAAELPDRLDVEQFATYLAMMDLVDNFDDIDGPGNNSYLHWDASSGTFTVVPWDMNLAFGQFAGGPGGGPGGFAPPDGIELPEDFVPGEGFGPGAGPGGFGGSNPLVERFLAVEEWSTLVDARTGELRARLLDSGVADGILDEWAAVVRSALLVDDATIAAEVDALRTAVANGAG